MPRPAGRITLVPGRPQCSRCGLLDHPEHPVSGPHPLALCAACVAEDMGMRLTVITSEACDALADALFATPGTSED